MMTYIVTSTLTLWVTYIIVMKIRDFHDQMEEGWKKKLLFAIGVSIMIPGYILDLVFNATVGTIIFFRLPDKLVQTFTSRLQNIIRFEPSSEWRWKLAHFICSRMLHPWDDDHCWRQ